MWEDMNGTRYQYKIPHYTVIGSHVIDLVIMEYYGFHTRRFYYKQLEMHGCILSTVATDAQFHTWILPFQETTVENKITYWIKNYPIV